MSLTTRLIDWTERGLIPDALVRWGIRGLCKQRLRDVDFGNCEHNQARLQELLLRFSEGPIAWLPEKANEQHYEVPAAFYELVLGPRKKYSCCFFEDASNSLEEAEKASLEQTCHRAEIENGQQILELGCGWGSLTLWLAEKYPDAAITAVSNSRSQREHILNEAESKGIDHNLTVITCDMNDFEIDKKFDRVISIEMFEHMRNYQQLLGKISSWLSPMGKLFVHIFCHREFAYEFEDQGAGDWMSRYFFSGGIMPSDDLLLRFNDHLRVSRQWRWNGLHYHRTSEAWLANLDRNKHNIMPVLIDAYGTQEASRWFYRWRLFFLAVSELFNANSGQEWWVSHYLFERAKVLDQTSIECPQMGSSAT